MYLFTTHEYVHCPRVVIKLTRRELPLAAVKCIKKLQPNKTHKPYTSLYSVFFLLVLLGLILRYFKDMTRLNYP